MLQMCGRFPGSVVIRVTNPLDQVFLSVMTHAVIEYAFYFKFEVVVDGDRVRRGCMRWAVCYGVRRLIWAKYGNVEDGVDLEGGWKFQLVGDCGYLLNNAIRANK